MITINIPGVPVAKGRPRLGRFHTYTPKKTVDHEEYVKLMWLQQHGNKQPSEKALTASVTFLFEPPKSYTKTQRKKAIEGMWHVKKPDIDNLIKTVTDSLNGLAYKDDSQIVKISAYKQYSEHSGTLIELCEL